MRPQVSFAAPPDLASRPRLGGGDRPALIRLAFAQRAQGYPRLLLELGDPLGLGPDQVGRHLAWNLAVAWHEAAHAVASLRLGFETEVRWTVPDHPGTPALLWLGERALGGEVRRVGGSAQCRTALQADGWSAAGAGPEAEDLFGALWSDEAQLARRLVAAAPAWLRGPFGELGLLSPQDAADAALDQDLGGLLEAFTRPSNFQREVDALALALLARAPWGLSAAELQAGRWLAAR